MVGADRDDADPMISGNLQATRLGVGMGRFRRRPRLATGEDHRHVGRISLLLERDA